MSETFDDQFIHPRDMADRQFVAWVREDIHTLSPKMLSYSQRCELFDTILYLCDRLEKCVNESEKKTKEIQEINRVLMDESAQWRSRELWKSSCEAKDAENESLRKIAEAAREYRKALDKGVRAGMISVTNLPEGAEYGMRADQAAEKLDAAFAETPT